MNMNPRHVDISIVVPVYGCADTLYELVMRIDRTISCNNLTYEIILVDDRSKDDAWIIIKDIVLENTNVKGVRLSNNFGQHYAVAAGFEYARGDWCVVMDCDLQDRPEEIINLYNKALEGFDIVMARRDNRQDSYFVKLTSKLFFWVFNSLVDMKVDNRLANFGICSRKVVNSIRRYKEKDRSFGFLTILVGYSRAEILVEHASRKNGESSYSFSQRLDMAVSHVLSHSNKPLLFVIRLGFFLSSLGVLYGLWLIVRSLLWGKSVDGWTSIMVSMYFLVGLVVMVIGVVGIYVGKIYSETKNRPLYIVDELTEFDGLNNHNNEKVSSE